MFSSLSSTMSTVLGIVIVPSAPRGIPSAGLIYPSDDNLTREHLDEMQTPNRMTSHRKIAVEEAESVAVSALSFIVGDDEGLAPVPGLPDGGDEHPRRALRGLRLAPPALASGAGRARHRACRLRRLLRRRREARRPFPR